MSTTPTTPRTAQELFALLEPCEPRVEGADLVFGADPPTDQERALQVLHTGVRAQLAGRAWYGCASETGRVDALSPAAPIPEGITLLCVEGDRCWDRINPCARIDMTHLFAPAASSGSSRPR